jgi:phosphoglycolate phosphatase-like HAD superfamily hydrolase
LEVKILKAILFDLEGTLVETEYQRSGYRDIEKERSAVRKKIIALGVPKEVLNGLVRQTLVRNRAINWAKKNLKGDEVLKFFIELDLFMKSIEMRVAKKHKIFPETLDALSTLKSKNIKMGIVTNTSREAADYILKTHNLDPFFKVIVSREDADFLKPNPELIHIAVRKIGKPVKWFIGDTIFDAEAAANAGLKSIIIQHNNYPPSFRHDYFIDSLIEVASIILE